VYLQTGNVKPSSANALRDFGESALKLSSGTLEIIEKFVPADQVALDVEDLDLGSSGPLLLPFGNSSSARLLVLGKQGIMTLHNTGSMSPELAGQRLRVTFNQHNQIPCLFGDDPARCVRDACPDPNDPNSVNTCDPNNDVCCCCAPREHYPHIHATPVVWEYLVRGSTTQTETRVYTWGEKDVLRAHLYDKSTGLFPTTAITNAQFFPPGQGRCLGPNGCFTSPDIPNTTQQVTPNKDGTGAFGAGAFGVPHAGPNGMPGGSMSISADSTATESGIVWVSVNTAGNSEGQFCPGILRAYAAAPTADATPVMKELWNNINDPRYFMAKFTPPTVFNGRVYVAGCTLPTVQPDASQPFAPGGGNAWTTNALDIHGHVFVYGR